MTGPTGEQMRLALFSAIDRLASKTGANFQSGTVLRQAAEELGVLRDQDQQIALLTLWNDLLRQGQIGWGFNVANPDPPFCHLTARGREALRNISRDPANPDGYISCLLSRTTLNPIAQSYIAEALETYNSNCFKATAVMVGCAAESLSLELRDEILLKLAAIGGSVPADLKDWRIRTVVQAIQTTLDLHKPAMQRELREAYEAYWPAFVQQIRVVRNDAGHPLSVDPITPEVVHSALLVFPELAVLTSKMKEWVKSNLT